ncbi:MAG TPA: Fe-S cluster assembly protein SufD [Rubricoccaceae bacterium]|jgi:Fe-S cluster assembly protein SufD
MIDIEKAPTRLHAALHALDGAFEGDSASGDGAGSAPDPFADLRRDARGHFERLGIPTRRDEAWKYTDLRAALAHDYTFTTGPTVLADDEIDAAVAAAQVDGLSAFRLVVVDGVVDAGRSDLAELPAGVDAGSLREAAAAGGTAVADYFGKYADVERNTFAALNTAFRLDGLFLHVRQGVELARPVHVVHVTAAVQPTFVQTRHLVVVEANASATVVETFVTAGTAEGLAGAGVTAATFRNDLTEIVVGRGARVEHVRIQDEGPAANGVSLVQVYQEADSQATTMTFTFSTATVRNNTVAVPAGPGCTTTIGGLYVCHGTQHVDTNTLVDHVAPGCVSNERFKGIVYDQSVGVFNGKVFVRREAQQTNAYQQSQGVVLSPDAKHFSKPELEIYADDVKCSHGSTTGAIDPEALFYLRARGLSESQARSLLLYAFAHDVVEMVASEPLRDHLDARIAERLT